MTHSAIGVAAPRLMLGRQLRWLRERAGLTLEDVATGVDCSKATWRRVENGETSLRGHTAERACQVLGVTNTELIGRLTELAKQTKDSESDNRGWLESYDAVASQNFLLYTSLEASAETISSYDRNYLPGLLQTPGYMRDLMATEAHTGLSPDLSDLEKRIEVRLKRQEILTKDNDAPTMVAVIHESALRPPYAGPEAMREQLTHLLQIGERDNVSIRVMPADRSHAGEAVGHFVLLEFPTYGELEFPSHLYIDGYLSFYLTDKADEVVRFRSSWPNIWETALDEPQTRDFLARRLAKL
jgi:transcriptional regulator with XRE-family HTH domain